MTMFPDRERTTCSRRCPDAEWARSAAAARTSRVPLGQVLYESGGKMSHVYFPTTAIVSLLYVMEDGGSAEIAVVGHEGIVGISLFMGGESTPSRAVVQSAGQGFRLRAQTMKDEFNRAGPVLHLLLRYTQALITQMAQTAVCNRHHSLDQQLCRWLLLSLDRLQGSELVMTQELIANMLGVRREGVTEAAPNLQKPADPLRARPHLGARPPQAGAARLRVLWRGQEGVRPAASREVGDLAAAVVRYEREAPGELLHMDTKKLGRIVRPGHRVTGDRRDSVDGAAGSSPTWPSMTTPEPASCRCTATSARSRRWNF